MIHHSSNCRIGGTLARYSSGRLDRHDASQPSQHADPNRDASPPGGLATEHLRPPTAPLSRVSTRCIRATRRPCWRSLQGGRPARPRVKTCELDSCSRSYSTLHHRWCPRPAPPADGDRRRAAIRLLSAISIARSIAGCAGFLILIQSRQRPER